MRRIDKNGKKDGAKLEEILKEGYLCYLRHYHKLIILRDLNI